MSLKKLLVLNGVVAACRFQDDGSLLEAAGGLPMEMVERLARFSMWYRRMVSGNTDLLSLFGRLPGWSPSKGWVVRGAQFSICSMANVVCMVKNDEGTLQGVMKALEETAHE